MEDSHAFFVEANGISALVHNTKPGSRVYIVYRVDLDDGTKYIGRASMPYTKGTEYDAASKDALKRRFKDHHRASFHPGFSFDNANVIWSGVYDTGKTSDKARLYGTMRGVEHVEEGKWHAQGKSANRSVPGWKLPIGDRNPNRSRYLNLQSQFGTLKCLP